MSGVRRFLSRRDRDKSPHHNHKQENTKTPKPPDHFHGIFTNRNSDKKADKDEEKKVKAITERLRNYGIDNITESNIEYALRAQTPQGDAEAAFRLLMLLEDTYEGIIRPYNPNTKLVGAVNKEGVTCYLDSLLFGMFARLDSFEAMIYDNFEDANRKRLAGLLRLWVNMLRTGNLIRTDITHQLTNALADCGWKEAAKLKQQDPSEAFTFITGQLELPMLTLKMDMYHRGKEDPQDDHKFVNERLLEVAILDEPAEGRGVITLEDCLEHYFNNRIEVKRLMGERRNTLKSAQSPDQAIRNEKESGLHVEVAEIPGTPISQSPVVLSPFAETQSQASRGVTPSDILRRPIAGRKRAESIFSQRKIEIIGTDPERADSGNENLEATRDRKMSTRTEVLMPAWQFFKLLPWYTDNMPTSDAQVAAHFSKKRPVLGICLKRYSYTNAGQARRLDTYVDIPLEIAVPNFVSDEHLEEEGPLVGNFRLMLQSVVCHRGVSVNSGHYVCLSRGRASNAQQQERRGSAESDDIGQDPWMRFDDLARERISYVDIHEALKKEVPYLLFYQVQPIGDDGHSIHTLPSYDEATSRSQSDAAPLEKPPVLELSNSNGEDLGRIASEPTPVQRTNTEVTDWTAASERTSMDVGAVLDVPRGGNNGDVEEVEGRRRSTGLDTGSFGTNSGAGSMGTDANSNSLPATPSEEKSNTFFNVANRLNVSARRGSQPKKGNGNVRPTSTENANRFSLNMSKLTQRMSKADSVLAALPVEISTAPASSGGQEVSIIQPSEQVAAELSGQKDAEPIAAFPPINASKENVTTSKSNLTLPKLTKKEKGSAKKKEAGEKREASGKQDDRDCALM